MDLGTKCKLSLKAPAKVNLRLKVTGRREDGYHLLDMVMVPLELADEIEIEVTAGANGIELESDRRDFPTDATNSVWRAAELVRNDSGLTFGLKARIKKRIPIAAGLGGGSSDAAAVLKGLSQVLNLDWSESRLQEVGLKVGADVPFFLAAEKGEGAVKSQRVQGIGEGLTPFALPPLEFVLINPGFPVSTADVYQWYDEKGKEGAMRAPLDRLTVSKSDDSFPRLLQDIGGVSSILENDLEGVVIPRYPVLAEIKRKLLDAGALGSLMSGSGGTVFGLFDSRQSRDRGYETLIGQKNPSWWICKTASL